MEMTLNKNDLKEIDYIIDHFIENNKNETISVPALAFCLQKLIEGKEELVEAFEGGEEDD
jgi:hypothetical protein